MAVKSVRGVEGKNERDFTALAQGSAYVVPLLQCIELQAGRMEIIFPYMRPFKRGLAPAQLREAMRDILAVCFLCL